MGNKIWQNFRELKDEEQSKQLNADEFKEELPFEDIDGKGWLDAKSPRRDFLKYLGFSTAAATIAASCKIPQRKVIPFANKPEDVFPGVAKYYATTYVQDGDVVPVIAKVRDGRPIKLEGNPACSFTKGGTSARVQASVLDLYDMYRLPHPQQKISGSFKEIPTFDQLDRLVIDALAGLGGAPVVLLTSTINSPTTKQIISSFLAKYPGSRHVQYDGVSYSGMLESYGANNRQLPSYHFDKAKVIVSLGTDFLGTWLSPVEYARGYSVGRKIDEKNPQMSKHYQFESFLSMTGSNADERFNHRPSETGNVVVALLAAVGGSVTAPTIDAKLQQAVNKVAADLKNANGAAVVVCGSNDVNIQTVVNAINQQIGAYGNTIDWSQAVNYRQGIDKDMTTLISDMEGGRVGALLVYGANPVYDHVMGEQFKKALSKVKLSLSFTEKMDETTELCQYSVPTHHFLESWGDAEPKAGYFCFLQPTIFPIFKTRYFQTSLLKWSGDATPDYETYFRNYWTGKLGGDVGFDQILQVGVNEKGGAATATNAPVTDSTHSNQQTQIVPATQTVATSGSGQGSRSNGDVGAAATAIAGYKKGGKNEIALYQKSSLGTGKQAGNPWLQELPDPVSKATWDNYALISTAKAKELGIEYTTVEYEYHTPKPVIGITVNGKTINLPVIVTPGMDPNTIAVAVGYGHSEKLGLAAGGVGQNVYQFASFNGNNVIYNNDVTIANELLPSVKVARMQVENTYMGRKEVVRETTLASFKKNPEQYKEYREELKKDYAPVTGDYRSEGTIYPEYSYPGPKWGMLIDMNSCIGCNACVVACHAENNVPVVGKNEVLRFHDMHWLRIDRYFVSNEKNPDELASVVFQPMLCQHCDNAPCENVCPVTATNHSNDGINQMVYNRCIGTRYCANNCPYKVRRFNWADYTGADSFPHNTDQSLIGKLNEVVTVQMMDDITRMVLNPDVTVRSRGVMEKCSFCVQRTQEAKLNAKKQNRPLKDGDVVSACQQACPTNAIVFGNINDSESTVSKMREENELRSFYVIEQLHTLPNITYLAKVRNSDEIIEEKEGH